MSTLTAIHAWTGGSSPMPYLRTSRSERQLVHAIFRNTLKQVHDYWGDYAGLNETTLDNARIHWRRARYDAHATMRQSMMMAKPLGENPVSDMVREWDKAINDYTYGKPSSEDIVQALCKLQAAMRRAGFLTVSQFLLDAETDSNQSLRCLTSVGDIVFVEDGTVIKL